MKVTKETLEKMAHLARLEVKKEDEDQLIGDLSEILTWVEELNEVDTENVEPLTHMTKEINSLREDSPINHLKREDALKSSPRHNNEFFTVPNVIKSKDK